MFNTDVSKTVKGTVEEFRWSNPHAILMVAGKPDGEIWTIELTSPGNLRRFGWTRHALAAGDAVTVTFAPLRDGARGGALMQVALASGKKLFANHG